MSNKIQITFWLEPFFVLYRCVYNFYIVLTLAADKRLLVDIYLKVKRGREEKILLERDMKSYMQFYTDKITDLKKTINQFEFMLSSASATGHSTNEKVSTNFFLVKFEVSITRSSSGSHF